MPRLLLCTLLLGLSGLVPVRTYAQAGLEPFDSVELRMGLMQNVNRNFLHEYWQQGFGGELSAAIPFYHGFAEAGTVFHRYRVSRPVVPGFDALLAFVGWGAAVHPVPKLRMEAAARLGNYWMTFNEQAQASVRNESELATMFTTRVALHVVGPVSLHVSGHYLKVYTFHRLKLWYLSGGVSYQFRSPRWLEHALR